jgi:hypothetical protein
VPGDRSPYRIQVLSPRGDRLLVLRGQDRWTAAGRNIFCLREDAAAAEAHEEFEELERISIVVLQRRSIRTTVILDRSRYKRAQDVRQPSSPTSADG